MAGRGGLTLVVLAAVLALAGCGGGRVPVPPRPSLSGAACLNRLDEHHVDFSPVPMHAAYSACSVDNPVRIRAAAMTWNPSGLLACGFAARFDDFLRDTVQPLARRKLGASIRAMRDYGTYACRREIGGKNRMSEHAVGLAIDVAGFWLANGDYVSVQHDWRDAGAKSRFLHAFARAACRRFSVVLTPDANRYHYNHIHIDAGPWHLCGMHRAAAPAPAESVATTD